jgi:hypothetical protein
MLAVQSFLQVHGILAINGVNIGAKSHTFVSHRVDRATDVDVKTRAGELFRPFASFPYKLAFPSKPP